MKPSSDFQHFPGPALEFQDFSGLENNFRKFKDFQGFPGPVQTRQLLHNLFFTKTVWIMLDLFGFLFFYFKETVTWYVSYGKYNDLMFNSLWFCFVKFAFTEKEVPTIWWKKTTKTTLENVFKTMWKRCENHNLICCYVLRTFRVLNQNVL